MVHTEGVWAGGWWVDVISSILAELARLAVDVVHSFGYVGVFVLVLAGSLFVPIPTELTLPLFGFLVGQGRLSFVTVLVTATAARVSASLLFYALGLRIGEVGPRRIIERIERTKLLSTSDLNTANGVFVRHGGKAILIGHLVPGVGPLISVPAGLKRMPIRWRFLGYTVLGSTLWTGTLVGLGWTLGRRWRIVELYASLIGYVVLAALIFGILWFLWRRGKGHR
jgi:membrane protein DedA with SNARE-associated domain